MARKAVVWNRFAAGWSNDIKVGPTGSYAFSQAFDIRKSPGQISVLPGMRREDNGVVTDLIQNTVMDKAGVIYGIGNSGRFYRRSAAGVWSLEASLAGNSSGVGMDIRQDADMLLIAGNKSVSRYMPLSASSTILVEAYGASLSYSNNSATVGFNVSANQEGSTSTYTPLTSLNENSVNRRMFQSDIEPLSKIGLFIVTKGSGDWTLTLHDGLNNVLATKTITNANLTSNDWNEFTFSSQVRAYVTPNARTYHVHVTSTVADGSISCSGVNDMSTCDLQVWADRMVDTVSGLHPIVRFQQYECIANGNYLSVWEPLNLDNPSNSEWQRHRLSFPMEYEMIGLAQTNEFLVMSLARVSTSATSAPQQGLLAFWSGTSPTYDFIVPIPEGSPQALHTYKNVAYYYAGGDWWAISSPLTEPVKIRSMPGSSTEYSGSEAPVTVYPYAAAVRRGVHLFAWPSVTTDTEINFGVYSWGQTDKNWPEAFAYNYLPSTGSQNYSVSNNLQLGGIWSYGDTLIMSWRDSANGGYGVDIVDNSSSAATTAIWESLVVDNRYPNKQLQGLYVDCYFYLPEGATLTLGYKLDREADWHTSEAFSTTSLWNGQTGYARLNIDGDTQKCREIQGQIVITTPSGEMTPPKVYCYSTVYEDLSQEQLA